MVPVLILKQYNAIYILYKEAFITEHQIHGSFTWRRVACGLLRVRSILYVCACSFCSTRPGAEVLLIACVRFFFPLISCLSSLRMVCCGSRCTLLHARRGFHSSRVGSLFVCPECVSCSKSCLNVGFPRRTLLTLSASCTSCVRKFFCLLFTDFLFWHVTWCSLHCVFGSVRNTHTSINSNRLISNATLIRSMYNQMPGTTKLQVM